MAQAQVTVRLDAAQAQSDLQLLTQAAELSHEVRQRLLGLGNFQFELRRVQVEDLPAVPTGDVCMRLDLPNGLDQLAAAVRAGEFDAV